MHRLQKWLGLAAAFSLAVMTSSASAAQIEDLGTLSDHIGRPPLARGLSRDGRVAAFNQSAVGFLVLPSNPTRWTEDGGFEVLPGVPGGTNYAIALSGDGNTVVGVAGNQAAVWDAGGGLTVLDLSALSPLPGSNSSASLVSEDGTVVAGYYIDAFSFDRAFVWAQSTGAVRVPGGLGILPVAMSRDGSHLTVTSLIGGPTPQQNSSRWTVGASAREDLDVLGSASYPSWISDDGEVIVGTYQSFFSPSVVYRWTAATGSVDVGPGRYAVGSPDGSTVFGSEYQGIPWRWTEAEGFTPIPLPFAGTVTACSDDGSVAVGTRWKGGPPGSPGAREIGFRWSEASGVEDLPRATSSFTYVSDCSADGSIILGALANADISSSIIFSTDRIRPVRWTTSGFIGRSYCGSGVANSVSTGGGRLQLSGSNMLPDDALELVATDLPPGSLGYFLASRSQDLVMTPGGSQGTLCLGGSIIRFVGPGQIQDSGSLGSFTLTVGPQSFPAPSSSTASTYGETWNFQAWYRDANPRVTSNFTNGASVEVW